MPNINNRFYLSVSHTVLRYTWLSEPLLRSYIYKLPYAKIDLEKNPKSKKYLCEKQLLKNNPFIRLDGRIYVDIENFEKAPFVMGKTRNIEGLSRQPFTNFTPL